MRYILNFCVCVLIFALIIAIIPVNGEENIYSDVIRLHVIANSNSDEDQALKLKVRDAIIEYSAPLLEGCRTKEEAEGIFTSHLQKIEALAKAVIEKEGYAYNVSALLDEEKYPTRDYGDISLPAGNYLSLRVVIESGEGKNWWCVLFPPLCTSMAMGDKSMSKELCIEAGLTPSQYRLITESDGIKYKLKFKFLETLADLFGISAK